MRSIFKSVTVKHRDTLSLDLFLNAEALLLGEEPRFMTLVHAAMCLNGRSNGQFRAALHSQTVWQQNMSCQTLIRLNFKMICILLKE